jgi:uncharacterized protein YabN with tetrapyrrole methylase and pyrophosphatase domain
MTAAKKPAKAKTGISELLQVMARLRAPHGCPWDRQQDHLSLRFYAVEEVYELIDAIEAGDDLELVEELGDLLLQVIFHCQLAKERRAFDFGTVTRHLADKLIRRHPHVFGQAKVKSVNGVWAQWEKIKRAEKDGSRRARPSALDGIPRHLPALMRAEKLIKKARRVLAGRYLADGPQTRNRQRKARPGPPPYTKAGLARVLFALVEYAQDHGWCAEALLRAEIHKRERAWRRQEKQSA